MSSDGFKIKLLQNLSDTTKYGYNKICLSRDTPKRFDASPTIYQKLVSEYKFRCKKAVNPTAFLLWINAGMLSDGRCHFFKLLFGFEKLFAVVVFFAALLTNFGFYLEGERLTVTVNLFFNQFLFSLSVAKVAMIFR